MNKWSYTSALPQFTEMWRATTTKTRCRASLQRVCCVLHDTSVNFVSNTVLTPCSMVETNPADNYRPTSADCSTDPDSCPDVKMAASFHIPYDSSLASHHDLRHYAVVATCVNNVAVCDTYGSQSGFAIFTQRSKIVVPPSSGWRPQDTLLGRLDFG